jgi:hypothetical protein
MEFFLLLLMLAFNAAYAMDAGKDSNSILLPRMQQKAMVKLPLSPLLICFDGMLLRLDQQAKNQRQLC